MAENESKSKGNWKKEGWGKKPDTDTMIVTRIPPQNIDAEKSVLGAMLLDKDAIMTAEDKLTAADFYREANAIVFQAILNLAHKGEPADILTVTEELKRMGRLDDVGASSMSMICRRMWPPRRWWIATLTSSQTRRSSGG